GNSLSNPEGKSQGSVSISSTTGYQRLPPSRLALQGVRFFISAGPLPLAGRRQRGCAAEGQHREARGFEPGEPSQPASAYPEREGIGVFEKTAKRLEGRHRLQVDPNLFAVAVRRPAVNDLDVEARQARGCLGCADLALWCGVFEFRQASSP